MVLDVVHTRASNKIDVVHIHASNEAEEGRPMSTQLAVTVTPQEDLVCTVIALTGDLDKITTPLLRTAFDDVLSTGQSRIVVDMAELDFCDSTALWALLEGMRRTYESGGWLRLAGVRGFLERILRVTKLYEAFPIDANVTDSLQYASGGGLQASE